MNKFATAERIVTGILESNPETRSNPLEVIRRVFYAFAFKPRISRSRIDNCIDTILEFKAAGVDMETHLRAVRDVQNVKRPDLADQAKKKKREAAAEEYREHYSPKDTEEQNDLEQTTLF